MIVRNANGQFAKGSIQAGTSNGFYGKTHSEETRTKLSKIRAGRKLSDNHREKLRSAAQRRKKKYGYINSPEARKKLSETRKALGLSRGEKSSLWKDGRWSRNPKEYMRVAVLARIARKKKLGGSHTLEEWLKLKEQYSYMCPSCLRKEPEVQLEQDHVVSMYDEGTDDISNIQPLCRSCNSRKGKQSIRYSSNRCHGLLN